MQGLLEFQNSYSQVQLWRFIICSRISNSVATRTGGALSQLRFLPPLSPVPAAPLTLEQLLTLK